MLDVGELELAAIRSAFCTLIARWRLTQGEVRLLLGLADDGFAEGRVLPDRLGREAETRMRLLIRLEDGLERIAPDVDVCARMRRVDARSGMTLLSTLEDVRVMRKAVHIVESELSSRRPWSGRG